MKPFIQTVIGSSCLLFGLGLLSACAGSSPSSLVPSTPGGSQSGTVHKFATLHEPGTNATLATTAVKPAATHTFKFTGAPQSYTVPEGVTHLGVTAFGAAGGGGAGGPGGTTTARISVHSGQVLGIFVGGKGESGARDCESRAGGYNGGGESGHTIGGCAVADFVGGGGGGASDVRDGGINAGLEKRIVVAGGGGGEAPANIGWWSGGAGGGRDGGKGDSYYDRKFAGDGGTQTGGGAGGTGPDMECWAKSGGFGRGGRGGDADTGGVANKEWSGGGGGGGYHGGGGGAGNCRIGALYPDDGAGGGGSGFVASGANNVKIEPATNPDDGVVEIVEEP